MLSMEIGQGLLIPFLGTVLGAGCVFILRQELRASVQKALLGFAAGIMIAASVWSLLIPSMDACSGWGSLAFLPALTGFWAGTLFLLLLDHVIPHLHIHGEEPEGLHRDLSKKMMLILAVTLHNIPEGMAVGVVLAGWLSGQTEITGSAALILSVGIAIQNFPEGAIISMPLRAAGMSRTRAFLAGAASSSSLWADCSPLPQHSLSHRFSRICWLLLRGPWSMWWWRNFCRKWLRANTPMSESFLLPQALP